jgi:hypothetical protein
MVPVHPPPFSRRSSGLPVLFNVRPPPFPSSPASHCPSPLLSTTIAAAATITTTTTTAATAITTAPASTTHGETLHSATTSPLRRPLAPQVPKYPPRLRQLPNPRSDILVARGKKAHRNGRKWSSNSDLPVCLQLRLIPESVPRRLRLPPQRLVCCQTFPRTSSR